MKVQARFYSVVAVLTIGVTYVGGVAFSATCEKGCKSVGAYTYASTGGCTAYREASCYSDDVWVDGVEKDAHGLETKCLSGHSSGNVKTYSCSNCTEVCDNTGSSDLREMSKSDPHQNTEDCSYSGEVLRKACG